MKTIPVFPVAATAAAAASCLSLSVLAHAEPPALAVKMGQWQITTTTKMSGQPPSFDTSKLPPEQKARVETMMKALMAEHTRTGHTCVSKDTLQQANFLLDDQDKEDGSACKRTLQTNTKKELDSKVECTGESARSAELHIEASSPTSIKGSMRMSQSRAGHTMTMNATFTGKWVAAQCKSSD